MKTLIKILISIGCGIAVYALCALVYIWYGAHGGSRGMEDLFQYLVMAFLGLVTFVVVLVLQLYKVRMRIIIGITLFPIVLYSTVTLVKYIDKQISINAYLKQYKVENPWGTKSRKTLLMRLQAGENIDKTNEKGQTLLHYAADIGDLNLMKFAIENGADINKTDEEGCPAAYYAVRKSWTLLEYLADNGADLSKVEVWREPLTFYAIDHPDADAAKLSMLIKHGVSVHAVDESGRTALFVVKTAEMAQVLIDAGADVNAKSNDKYKPTPLFAYLDRGTFGSRYEFDLEMIKLLIDAGADLEARRDDGGTPLLAAMYHRKAAMFLIDAGADIHVRNNDGDTPLFRAARLRDTELLKALVKQGVDKNMMDSKGRTAYKIALENGLEEKEIEFLKIVNQ